MLHRLNHKRDNWILNTGEEGEGKSTTARKVSRRMDHLMHNPEATVQMKVDGPYEPLNWYWTKMFPGTPRRFALENHPGHNRPGDSIRFGQDALLSLLTEEGLEVGGIAIGDEIEGNKRLAMHGKRLELLDHTKEARALRHNVWVNFPHVTEFEKSLFRTRMAWWLHHPARGVAVLRERRAKVVFNLDAEPEVDVKWPVVGQWRISPDNDPWEALYDQKKLSRMRARNERRDEEEAPVMAKPGPEDFAAKSRIAMILADIGQSELKG